MVTKKCSKCGKIKPVEGPDVGFDRSSEKLSGFRSECKDCRKQYRRRYHKANKDKIRAYYAVYRQEHADEVLASKLAWHYGLTVAQYRRMLKEQGGVCAICRRKDSALNRQGRPRRLSVDHDHNTGEVRRLLCHYCNSLIGMAKSDPAILRAAAAYLEAHATCPPRTSSRTRARGPACV